MKKGKIEIVDGKRCFIDSHEIRSLEELKKLAKPVFSHHMKKELIEIARNSSPSEATRRVKRELKGNISLQQRCRWLAQIFWYYGDFEFDKFVSENLA